MHLQSRRRRPTTPTPPEYVSGTIKMGKTVEHADEEPLKMKKKSKKNKNMTDDLMSFGDGNSNVETDSDHTKKKKRDKHMEKKRKSELKDDGETDDLLMKKKSDKHKEKKRKAESKDDSDEDQHDKGNLVIDDSQKNKKKKRKYSSEEAQVQENESDQNAGPDVEKDRDPKPEKKQKEDIKKTDKKKKKTESVVNNTEKPKAKSKSKSKKVSFSGHVEVFPTSDMEPEKQTNEDGLVRGKRFTPEEDAIIKQAVLDYVTTKDLGDEGLKMILNCRSHKGMKKCWQEIGLCIPYRPHTAVYYRAHNLFERAETRSWTSEEIESLKEFHEKYGNDWKKIAEELGKHRFHVKDTWRRIKLANLKGGRWSQEEYQNLYDLVNLDLQMKVSGEEKKKSKHGMLRDNIPWTAISEKLSTRSDATCCEKWYNQLTSSLVAEKKWSDADDYRMIGALYELDAACVDDVDWDNVLEHRPGEICLKRWNQMVKHIGDYGSKTFGEQVDILAERYCPDLAETREVWDKKPVVP